ncbi:MAG: ATP-binding protein, partial [Ignavibacteriaceae bacterium]|nr:ATP-binding protein [Ignavibacteriaceae bacterium]
MVKDLTGFHKNGKKENIELAEYRLAELSAVIESIPDAIIIGDHNGIIHCNSKAFQLLGLDSIEDLSGNYEELAKRINLRSSVNDSPLKSHEFPMVRALNNEKFEVDVLITNVKTGNDIVIRIAGAPVVLNGKVIAGVVIESDISERIKSDENLRATLIEIETSHKELNKSSLQLKNYTLKLENLNETKDKLFSIIAHDLRSPFQALTSVTNILIDEMESLNKDEILLIAQELRKTVKTQFEVVDNLLSWVQIQRGRMQFYPRRIFLYDKVKLVMEQLLIHSKKKNIEIINSVPEDLVAVGDMDMLQSVFHNILFNGIKYCNIGGQIKIDAALSGREIITSIQDNGIGMDNEIKDLLFSIDNNVVRHGTMSEKGTGLGLNLCREMINKQGGRIWVESEVGKGSTFYF